MTIAAVAVLQTIARNEFEQDVNSSEDFDWIEGRPWDDPPAPPVTEIVVELEGKNYVFPAAEVVKEIKDWEDYFRYEVEEEDQDDDDEISFHFDWSKTEEAVEFEIWKRVHQHFFAQLDTAEEAMAAFEARLDYLMKQFDEMVAHFNMIGERMPELRPHLLETLEMAHKAMTETLQKWIDENTETTGSL